MKYRLTKTFSSKKPDKNASSLLLYDLYNITYFHIIHKNNTKNEYSSLNFE